MIVILVLLFFARRVVSKKKILLIFFLNIILVASLHIFVQSPTFQYPEEDPGDFWAFVISYESWSIFIALVISLMAPIIQFILRRKSIKQVSDETQKK